MLECLLCAKCLCAATLQGGQHLSHLTEEEEPKALWPAEPDSPPACLVPEAILLPLCTHADSGTERPSDLPQVTLLVGRRIRKCDAPWLVQTASLSPAQPQVGRACGPRPAPHF